MMGLLSSFEPIVGGGKVCVDRHVVSMLCIVFERKCAFSIDRVSFLHIFVMIPCQRLHYF